MNQVQTDNKTQQLKTDKRADFIFKKGDYTHTYIVLETSGFPENTVLNLVDSNFNQLYSPYDIEGNVAEKTPCYVISGGTDAIQLPAYYNNSNPPAYEDFPVGIYNWFLKLNSTEMYETKFIPITVEIRDFNRYEVLKDQIHPFENFQAKLRTYIDTPPLSDDVGLYKYVNNSYVQVPYGYDEDTGIITYLGDKLEIGHHNIYVKNNNIQNIEYEIVGPIILSSSIEDNSFKLTAQYLYDENTPMVNSRVIIKNIDSNETVYEGYTNNNGEIYYSTPQEGQYQAFAFNEPEIIRDININNGNLILDISSVYDNDNTAIVNIDDTQNIFDIIIDEYNPNIDVLTNIYFDGRYLFFNSSSTQNQISYYSNIVTLANNRAYTSMNIDDGVILMNDVDMLNIEDNNVITDIHYDEGNLNADDEKYTSSTNFINDINADNGVLTYKKINDI